MTTEVWEPCAGISVIALYKNEVITTTGTQWQPATCCDKGRLFARHLRWEFQEKVGYFAPVRPLESPTTLIPLVSVFVVAGCLGSFIHVCATEL